MNVSEAIASRRSIRVFEADRSRRRSSSAFSDAGRLAPSARNMQEWKFIIARDKAIREKLMKAAKNQTYVLQAPAVIVACGTITNVTMTCGQLTYPIDIAIALDHMTLQAVEEGLGTCWIGAFSEPEVKAILGTRRRRASWR